MTTEAPPRRVTARQATLLAVVTVAAAAGHIWYGNRHHFFDLAIYRDAMRWWDSGHALYDFAQPDATQGSLHFTYPPFAAILLRPLAWLSWTSTVWLFTVVSVGAFALSVWWLVRPVAQRRGLHRWLSFGIVFLLATGLEPIREAYTLGQINFVLWALVLLDLVVLQPRGSRFVGVGIGVATAIKLIPGIFILYLLVSRRWRAAAVATGTAVVATLLGALIAPHETWTFFTEKAFDATGVGQLGYTFNQSLMGVLARLALPGEPSRAVWLLFAIPVLGYGLWRAGRASRAGDEVAGLTLAGIVGSLISPITWAHHIFWFIPAIIVLLDSGLPPGREVVDGVRGRATAITLGVVTYSTVTFSMLSLWDFTLLKPGGVLGFVLSNWLVWLMLMLMPTLPIRRPLIVTGAAQSLSPGPGEATTAPQL